MATIEITTAMNTKIGEAWKAANLDDAPLQAGTNPAATKAFFKARAIELLNPSVKAAARDDSGVTSAVAAFDTAKAAYETALTNRSNTVAAATADTDVNGAIS
jgi:hypothetical protein